MGEHAGGVDVLDGGRSTRGRLVRPIEVEQERPERSADGLVHALHCSFPFPGDGSLAFLHGGSLVKPGVHDGYGGVVGEQLDERRVSWGEDSTRSVTEDREGPDDGPVPRDRHP